MTDQATRIHDHLTTHPGVHFNELARSLDLAPGQVQYHLRKLQGRGDIVEEHLYGRTHYYPPEYDAQERATLALLRRETARDVLAVLLEGGPARPNEVADTIGIARSTLEWHLDHLLEQELVEKRRDERNHVTLVAVDPAETAALLGEVTLSLSGKLVDRFERLVDGLLSE